MPDASSDGMPALLGVERSLGNRRWVGSAVDDRLGLALAQQLSLPESVGRLLAQRGVGLDEADGFLAPSLKASLPDPSHLKDMDRAVERIAAAISRGEQIAILGDYDVDGATSTALLARYLGDLGHTPLVYIPDRLREGYGPNDQAMRKLAADGAKLIVTLDCGTTSYQALETAAGLGLDVIVVDHHEAAPQLPLAYAIVNPNRCDEDSPCGHLAAVGVTFLTAIALNRYLRETGLFRKRPEPDLLRYLDLVALGTICDVVPLHGLNRALTAQGLKVMAKRRNLGLCALADIAGLEARPDSHHIAFSLGPRINAGGRIGRSDLGAQLLATDDPSKAGALAAELNRLNDERKSVESAVQQEALAAAENQKDSPVIVVAGSGWHPGVIGIVAGRLKDRFDRPALVVSFDGDTGTGSGRSVKGAALGPAVLAARDAGILDGGGGHAMAAGFQVRRERLDEFRTFLVDRLGADLASRPDIPALTIDDCVTPAAIDTTFAASLARLSPYGAGNPEPRLVLMSARIGHADIVGKDHLRCQIATGHGRLKAMAFRAGDTALGHALLGGVGENFHLAGTVRLDRWQGRERAEFWIEDAAPAG